MNIETAFRDFNLGMAFDLDLWADGAKAEIAGKAKALREEIAKWGEKPRTTEQVFMDAFLNDLRGQQQSLGRQQDIALRQQLNYSPNQMPYGNPLWDHYNGLGGLFGFPQPCAHCRR